MTAKPFLKWAGGKTQLLSQIEQQLPAQVIDKPFTYIEPFVGSGAVLFWVLANCANVRTAVINDINRDLIDCYLTIRKQVKPLIAILQQWENDYHVLSDNAEAKKAYYYEKRTQFNARSNDTVVQTALFIFLNRTCFNGLYRVNRNNAFNVPIGSYKKPQICFDDNLRAVSVALKNVTILCGDYTETAQFADDNTLFYFDPPYKPLSQTSNFNTYAKDAFDDEEQIRLKNFCTDLDKQGHAWLLSNSDVKNSDPSDEFFDELYQTYSISRVNARRSINANASRRGALTELLIHNN